MKPLSNLQKVLLCFSGIIILFAVTPLFSLSVQTAILAVMMFLWALLVYYGFIAKDRSEDKTD